MGTFGFTGTASLCVVTADKKPFIAKDAKKGAKFAKKNFRSKAN